MIEKFDLSKLNPHTSQLLKIELYKDRIFECCPHCGSIKFIKHGNYRGIQRYKCHDCNKTFSKTTNSLWYYSKKQSNIWVSFAELFLEKQSLRECAQRLKINLSTSFYWRHKLISALKSNISTKYTYRIQIKNNQLIHHKDENSNRKHDTNSDFRESIDLNNILTPKKLTGDGFITYTYFQESNLNSKINFKMDYYRQEKRICIVAAKSAQNSMIIEPVSRNYILAKDFLEKVCDKIDKKSYIVAYKAKHIANAINMHNKKLSRKTKGQDVKIMQFEKNICKWFRKFYGISTKYLCNYLAYFTLHNIERCFKSLDFSYFLIRKIAFIKSHKIKFANLDI